MSEELLIESSGSPYYDKTLVIPGTTWDLIDAHHCVQETLVTMRAYTRLSDRRIVIEVERP